LVSSGRSKWTFLEVLEEGWKNKIQSDLQKHYSVSAEEVETLLFRYESIIRTDPTTISAREMMTQLSRMILDVNVVRGYLRHAYYVQLDDQDDIVAKIDEMLSKIGTGTPTSRECAESYVTVTGKAVNSEAVVLPGSIAESIADYLALQIEELQRSLSRLSGDPELLSEIVTELKKVDDLHVNLTGRSLVDHETIATIEEALRL